ncbi:hypothetical protein FOA52_000202 [Chlamydomonas sp. UWO 241]|nr:hypothetical protein FOA52_000202 [Chlamydomonas sp. UWO 241]
MDEDDDAPPPLSSLAGQVMALELGSSGIRPKQEEGDDASLQLAETTFVAPAVPGAAAPVKEEQPKLKKGFFDAKPTKKAAPKPKQAADDGITVLRGKKAGGLGGGGPAIPHFLRVEPDEQAKQMEKMKGELIASLKPDEETIKGITSNAELMAAFEDPEVMAAVEAIAKDPKAMSKYKDNRKVGAFYQAMAGLTGQRLEKLGDKKLGGK